MDEQTQFYYMMYPYVLDAMRKEGIDTAWASITTPQMMMEANWGRDPMVKYNNFFGMKADKSQDGVTIRTHEGYGDSKQYIDDKFLSFPSVEEGVKNGIIRLRDKFHAFEGEPSPEQYIKNINGTPGQIYFTEDPEVYLRNITSIRDGKRAQAAIEQYKKDEQQRKQAEVDKHISSILAQQTDATRVNNPYPTQVDNTKTAAIGPYRDEYKVTSSEDRAAKIRAAVKAKHDYEKIMKATNLKSTATEFKPKFTFDTGGFLQPKDAWDALSMQAKADVMRVAIKHGLYNLDDIRKKYNEFAEGGDKESWKALNNIEYEAIPDTTFTRDKTGEGSIEYFPAEDPRGITYNNGYYKPHPAPGKDVILFNPKENDEWDIRLDALHIMPKDATYDALNTLYRNAATDGDVAYNARAKYNEDAKKYGKENIDPYQQYFNNEADGLLRNMLIEGTPEYIESKRYYPNKQQLREWNEHLMPYVDRIHNYLITGERPANILPEIIIYGKKHSIGGPLVEAAMNEYANGGEIHIKPSHRGRLTDLKKRTGKTEAELYNDGNPAHKKMVVFARNSRKWKHGDGGNLFDGTSEDSQQMNIAIPDATYIAKTPIFSPISKKEYDWEEAALNRTNQVYSNYDEAKDEPLSWANTKLHNTLRWFQDRNLNPLGSGVSNCTLSATQWVDPNMPIKGAASIHKNPEKYNYSSIDSLDIVPGNLIISKVPNKDSYHTMMVTGFAGQDSTATFRGKKYPVKKGEPLMTYSRGGHDNSFIQRNVPLSIYTANSDGHTQNLFYRYNYPREVFLPEIVVTPNKNKK